MRIPLPKRISPKYSALIILAIFTGQLIEGTGLLMATLVAVCNALWVTAFNIAGGLEYASGAYILSVGVYAVPVGFTAKVLLGEAAQGNMAAPITTLSCYCLGMLGTVFAAYLTRAIRPKLPLVGQYAEISPDEMKFGSAICLFLGIFFAVATALLGSRGGLLLSALNQIGGGFPIMAIILATTYQIRRTNGKRSVNWVTGLAIGFYIAVGLIYFGKTGILLGFMTWVVTAVVNGYSFKKLQIAGLALGAFFFSYYLTPYSQYVRTFRGGSVVENIPIAIKYLGNLAETRRLYLESASDVEFGDYEHFFDERIAFLDRLVVIGSDDQLIAFTDKGNVFGLTPLISTYANVIPRFIWNNKPTLNIGNTYAHELNTVAEDDTTTGISFSAPADAFHQASWLGVILVLPLNLLLCFLVNDSLFGSTRHSPVPLLPVVTLLLGGGEGGISELVYSPTYAAVGVLVIVWTVKFYSKRVMAGPAPWSLAAASAKASAAPHSTRLP